MFDTTQAYSGFSVDDTAWFRNQAGNVIAVHSV